MTTATAGGYWVLSQSKPVLAATLVADNVSIETASGTISDVSISPSVTIDWENLPGDADNVDFTFSVLSKDIGAATFESILTRTGLSVPTVQQSPSGTASFSTSGGHFSKSSVLAHSKIAAADFEDTTEDGSPKITTVTVQVEVSVNDDSGTPLATTTASDDFTVSVNNQTASLSVSGKAGTTVEA